MVISVVLIFGEHMEQEKQKLLLLFSPISQIFLSHHGSWYSLVQSRLVEFSSTGYCRCDPEVGFKCLCLNLSENARSE